MKQRLGVLIEDVALALLRLSDRLRGTDHGPLPAMAYEVPPLTYEMQIANVNAIAQLTSDDLYDSIMGL